MDPLQQARMIAMGIQPHTPVFHAAVGLCLLRGIEPNLVQLSAGMLNWQAIVAEQVLIKQMMEELP